MIWDLLVHFTNFEGRTPDEQMAKLNRFADRMGIDRFLTVSHVPAAPA